jgi:hypothetical protein
MIIVISIGLTTIVFQYLYVRIFWEKLINPNYFIFFLNVIFALSMVFIPILSLKYLFIGTNDPEGLKNYHYSIHVWELFYVPSTSVLIYIILRGQKIRVKKGAGGFGIQGVTTQIGNVAGQNNAKNNSNSATPKIYIKK